MWEPKAGLDRNGTRLVTVTAITLTVTASGAPGTTTSCVRSTGRTCAARGAATSIGAGRTAACTGRGVAAAFVHRGDDFAPFAFTDVIGALAGAE